MKHWFCALLLFSACAEDQRPVADAPPAPGPVQAFQRDTFKAPPATQIDILLVIDNSSSMCRAQEALTEDLAGLSELATFADIRVAVTSTDLANPAHRGALLTAPAPPIGTPTCVDHEGNQIPPRTAGCSDRALSPVVHLPHGASPALLAEAQADLACMSALGTTGDDFEGGLEAMRLALSCTGPNGDLFAACCVDGAYDPTCAAEVEFLRPDAALIVLVLSDEDDCSAPNANPEASNRVICRYGSGDADRDGVPDGYRDPNLCNGVDPAACFFNECGNLNAEDCQTRRCEITRDDDNQCAWQRDRLTPVDDYRRFLAGLKARPQAQILVSGIVGPRRMTEAGDLIVYDRGPPVRPECDPAHPMYESSMAGSELCCPGGRCRGPVQAACESQSVQATAGSRYLELIDDFDRNGLGCPLAADPATDDCFSICDDQTSLMRALQRRVARFIVTFCMPALIDERFAVITECTDLDCATLQPAQALIEDVGYRLDDAFGCSSGAVLRLEESPPPSSETSMTYAIAPSSDGRADGVCPLPAACQQSDDDDWFRASRICVAEGGCGDQDCVIWESGPARCLPRCTRNADCASGRCASPLGIPDQQPDLCETAPCHCVP